MEYRAKFYAGLLYCLVLRMLISSIQGVCLPHCWDPGLRNTNVEGGDIRPNVTDEESCKILCINTDGCLGIDWDSNVFHRYCFLHTIIKPISSKDGVTHWNLNATCSGECLPYCWKPVQNDTGMVGGIKQDGVAGEDQCRLRCSYNSTCVGLDWDNKTSSCWFHNNAGGTSYSTNGTRHWEIIRNLSTSCEDPVSTSAQRITTGGRSEFASTTSGSTIYASRNADDSTTKNTAIIALAVLLAVSVAIIIGLVINTLRLTRSRDQTNNQIRAEDRYEHLQRTDANTNGGANERSSYQELQHRRTINANSESPYSEVTAQTQI